MCWRSSPNYPLDRGELPVRAAGAQTKRGYAWTPQAGVRQVNVRVNGGAWQAAHITDPQPNRYTWVRFEFPFAPLPGEYAIETRTTARNGDVQPAHIPYNKGGYNRAAIPSFRMRFA